MANTLKIAATTTSGETPDDHGLQLGELAINTTNKKVWVGTNGNTSGNVLLYDQATAYTDTTTNYYCTGLGFSGGTLTATVSGASNPTVSLDGRYSLLAHTHSYDNYSSWAIKANTGSSTNINSGNTVAFIQSGATTISRSGNDITISSTDTNTDTNHYLTGLSWNNANGVLTATVSGASNPTVDLDGRYSLSGHTHSYATESYVDTAIDNVIESAPGALATLNDLAAAINDDASYATTVTNALAGKLSTSGKAADSNLLDGIDSASFVRSDSADSCTQRLTFQANNTHNWDTIATASGSQGGLEIYNNGAGNDSFMSFHSGGDFAIYFGLDADNNKLSVGGWSMGAVKYEIYHSGNKPSLATLGFTGASNANYITDNSQITNGASYLTTSGKAADSDKLDGLDSGAFLRDDGWNTSPGQDANSQTGMRSDFSYSNNCPATGELIRFGAGGYSLQLNAEYGSGGEKIHFRTRNGDTASWNGWNEFYHTGHKPTLGELGFSGASNANYITNNNQLTNGAGYTTNTGTTTASNTQTFTNKSGNISQWTNNSGYTTNTGTTTASNSQTFTNKSGNISQWTNNSGYITDGNTGWNNTYGFVTSSGVTSVATGTGISGGTITSSGTVTLALGELPDMTAGWVNGTDEFIVLDNGSQARKRSAEIFGSNAFNSTTIPTNNNQLTNGAGYTTNTGTTTASNSQTFTNKGGNISQWTNNSGYTTNTGTTTASNSQTFTNKSGNISQWTNNSGYTTNTGTTTASNSQTFTNKGGNISQWTNNSGYVTSSGVTYVGTTAGLDGGGGSSVTISLDLAELADMTQSWTNASDEFIVLDSGTQKRKLSSEIFGSNAFNSTTIPTNNDQLTNGAGYTTNVGDITNVTASTGLGGGGSSGSVSIYHSSHSGEVTGSTSLTIADNVVDEANLKISNTGSNGQVLVKRSGNTGGMTWETAASGGSSAWNDMDNISSLSALP